MKSIFTGLVYAMEKKKDTVIAVIADKQGSVPRGKGSQMLISAGGRLAGTIGGGSVEQKSEQMALELLKSKTSMLHKFILRKNKEEDIGMVCGGDVMVWFQYIAFNDELWRELAGKILEQMEKHAGGWLIYRFDNEQPSLVGKDGALLAGAAAPSKLYSKSVWLPVPVGDRAVIFGAGHIARALVPLLSTIGFLPVVYDNRQEYTRKEDFPDAEEIICGEFDRISDYLEVKPEDYIVIMTSGHSYDLSVQRQLLIKDFAYMGVIGSRRKKEAVNAKLREAGIPEEKIMRVHTPVGTAIKAVTPAEIAVSIAGEMIYERAVRRENADNN